MKTVDQVVKAYLGIKGETSTHKYRVSLFYALEALKDWYMDSAGEVRTYMIPMDETHSIYIPSDYIDWVKIGIQVGKHVRLLRKNSHMALSIDNEGEQESSFPALTESDLGVPTYFYNFVDQYGEHRGGFYGYGAGPCNSGDFVIDSKIKRITFHPRLLRTNVYLEYLSNKVDPCGPTPVHPYFEKAMRLYIAWQWKENSDRTAWSDKERAKDEYYNELRLARARIDDFTIADLVAIMDGAYKLSVK